VYHSDQVQHNDFPRSSVDPRRGAPCDDAPEWRQDPNPSPT